MLRPALTSVDMDSIEVLRTVFFAFCAAHSMSSVAAGLTAVMVCRNPLQVIETGSYNFCRMAIFSLDTYSFQQLITNPKLTCKQAHQAFLSKDQALQQSRSVTQGTETLCSHSAEPGQEHGNAADEQPAVKLTETTKQESIVAVAGHDPAVLEIWSVTVSVYAHACFP